MRNYYIKLSIIMVVLIKLSNNLSAQNHILGFQSGVTLTKITGEKNTQESVFFPGFFYHNLHDPKFNNGFSIGLKYQYLLSKFVIGIDLNYNNNQFINKNFYTDCFGNPAPDLKVYTSYNFNYFSIPLKFGYNFGKKIIFSPKIGFQPSIFLNGSSQGPRYFEGDYLGINKYDYEKTETNIDLAGVFELEIGYNIQKKWNVFLLNQLSYGFNSWSKTWEEPRLRTINISIGVKYHLKKK